MKRGTPDHPKVHDLAENLKKDWLYAVGLLEVLWHYTARYAPRGDIGKWPDRDIAETLQWKGDPRVLIAALLDSGWLIRDPEYRLLVHDWEDHADQSVRKTLKSRGVDFARPSRRHIIYFLRSKNGRIKIGTTSRNVHDRVSEIQAASGSWVELLGQVEGSYSLEAELHLRFADSRLRGEWFKETKELLDFITHLLQTNTVPVKTAGSVPSSSTGSVPSLDTVPALAIALPEPETLASPPVPSSPSGKTSQTASRAQNTVQSGKTEQAKNARSPTKFLASDPNGGPDREFEDFWALFCGAGIELNERDRMRTYQRWLSIADSERPKVLPWCVSMFKTKWRTHFTPTPYSALESEGWTRTKGPRLIPEPDPKRARLAAQLEEELNEPR